MLSFIHVPVMRCGCIRRSSESSVFIHKSMTSGRSAVTHVLTTVARHVDALLSFSSVRWVRFTYLLHGSVLRGPTTNGVTHMNGMLYYFDVGGLS